MLQSMRHLAHSWVVKGLMLLLIISFSIWGIGDIFRGNPLQKAVAKAGDKDITVQELNHSFDGALAQARQRISPSLTASQARQMGLLDKTLETSIDRSLVDQDIKRLGIDVSPDAVLKLLATQKQFRTKDGQFNKALFNQLLDQEHLSESAFIAKGQDDLARQMLLSALSGSHTVAQVMVDTNYQARAQKRILDVVTIDSTKIGGIATPDDKTLHDFYDQNTRLFTAPEYRGITVASLSTDDLAKDISISEEQVKQEYDTRTKQLTHPEQRDLLQVVLQDEAKAKQLAAAARRSGDLTAVAKAAGEVAVPLDAMESNTLMPELSKIVFALPEGQISDPIKTQLGYHIVEVKKIIPSGAPSFESVKEKLKADMQRDQAIDAATRTINALDDQLAAGHSLEDIADNMKLHLVKIPAVDATGLTPDSKPPTELLNKDEVLKDAFEQASGETSPIEDDKAGHYYVVRTDEITPSSIKPFDNIKATALDLWKSHEQAQKAQAEASKIDQDLAAGKPLSSFASQEGVSVRTSLPLSRLGDSDPLLPPALTDKIFKIKKGETASGVDGDKQIVLRLAEIVDVDPTKEDPRKNMILGEIKKNTPNELLAEYITYLRSLFPVKIDAFLLDHLRQQDN